MKTTKPTPPPKPEYIRLPQRGTRCPYTSLALTTLRGFIKPSKENNYQPPVKSYRIVEPGKRRGIVLIDFVSLEKFIQGGGE